jgi:flagellar hook-length control protein FliK
MSGTSALLNLLEGSGSALLNAPETAQNGVSEADSSYFVSLMKQYEGVEPLGDAAPSKERDPASELLGNGLPMPLPVAPMPHPVLGLPSVPTHIPADLALQSVSAPPLMAPPPVMLPPAVEAEADTRLEEFAVGLGIDRELARLLLRETGPAPQPVAPSVPVPLPLASPTAPLSDPATATPLTQEPGLALVSSPPARSSVVSSVPAAPALVSPSAESRSIEIPRTMVGSAPRALGDEDVLRWRAFIGRSTSVTQELPQEVAVQATIDELVDPLSGAPRRGLSEADFAAATASLRGFALERRQIVTTTATAVSSTILSGDSPVDPAVLPMSGGVPINTPAAPSYTLGSPLAAQPDPLTTPLRVPDPTLQHELRAEQFAEQVGRRMLQQIREDRWTVNLQLDPQRLGPMDIELQLEGNQVTAQVGVASAEVRHLLEAALPKLRESLDSAGLNLANWSFAQSGAREYRDFAQQTAAAARKAAPSGSDVVVEDGNSRRMSDESASRVVDVYV